MPENSVSPPSTPGPEKRRRRPTASGDTLQAQHAPSRERIRRKPTRGRDLNLHHLEEDEVDEPSNSSLSLLRAGITLPSRISNTSIPTSAGDSSFQYRPIHGTEFRLVRLLPANMSTIKCELLHASLETAPTAQKYIAISYAWGDIDPDTRIQVDGSPFYITPSLHGALKRLRKQDESVMIWADALCIDQRNKTELSQQVGMMAIIYGQAESVAVWLGPESDDSELAIQLIREIPQHDDDGANDAIVDMIAADEWKPHFSALVRLFERDFWRRLWIVQEILNARSVTAYCGLSALSWDILRGVSRIFEQFAEELRYHFPRGMTKGSQHGLSYAHILSSQGPASLNVLQTLKNAENADPGTLLDVIRICRSKMASEPRDKVFGVLGVLPEDVRYHFLPDYNVSLREVYTNVVDFLLHTTRRIDVICEAIYFPIYMNTVRLPTWVPDWSHIPSTTALGLSYGFSAASHIDADFDFLDPPQRTRLKMSAIYLDTVRIRGIAVGTFCTLDDYLMAFLHWQAKPLGKHIARSREATVEEIDEVFCRTIGLGQDWGDKPVSWTKICYPLFASLIRDRLPHISMEDRLQGHAEQMEEPTLKNRRLTIQNRYASCMEGRCFFITHNGLMGMGSGFIKDGDVVCVPLGCRTPVILRPEGQGDEYRFVGDTYVDEYMDGKAVVEWKSGKRKLMKYILH
ncbi:hypothetical protein Hte_002972 [Hypoxylon texense]